jgi:hypothetical protein
MRFFFVILILIYSLQSLTKADDITDFEIEGIGIGDSLLDHFAEDIILNATTTKYPASPKYYDIHINVQSISENYDQISALVKSNDKTFKIQSIAGDKYFFINEGKNIDEEHLSCLKQKREITDDFSEILTNTSVEEYEHTYSTIDDGKSISDVVDFNFKDGSAIRIYCNKFTVATIKKRNFFNGLSVSITPNAIIEWIDNEAY